MSESCSSPFSSGVDASSARVYALASHDGALRADEASARAAKLEARVRLLIGEVDEHIGIAVSACLPTRTVVDTLKTLDTITAADRPRVGGKAFNCASLKQAGFPVPDALVVPADASRADIARLPAHPWLEAIPKGMLFAVRSSGLAEDSPEDSFAGMHDTELNVDRVHLIEAVLKCRRSANSEQARAYRAVRNLPNDEARIAVLVQCMVPAVTSGVAFTVNPVTGADEIVINSVAGLGDPLVSGQVNPDEQILAKTDQSALARLIVDVERHYGTPQDIEWCFDGTQYWIVQSRPVSTKIHAAPKPMPPRRTINGQEIEWTRANLAEVFPDQLSPQTLHAYLALINEGERAFFGGLMKPESELGPIMEVFYGRLYFNLCQLRNVTNSVGAKFADTLRSLGHAEQIHPDDEIAPKLTLRKLWAVLPDILRLAKNDLGMARIFREHQARAERNLKRLQRVDPRTLSDRDVWSGIQFWIDSGPESVPPVFVMSSVQAREDALRKACQRVGFSYEALVYPNLAAGQRSVSSQQAFDLTALADVARREPMVSRYLSMDPGTFTDFREALTGTAFLVAFESFLDAYGHRGRYESDWSIPRLRENPATALFAIREQLTAAPQDPAGVAARQAEEAAAAWRAFAARLTTWQRWTLLRRVQKVLKQLKQQYVWREQVRSDLTKVLAAVRPYHLALAERFVQRGWLDRAADYFLLLLPEIQRTLDHPYYASELRSIAARRAAQQAAERHLRMPLFMRESELPALLAEQAVTTSGDTLNGLCVSPGRVEAEVVVMRDPSEFAAMKRGAILVCTATDPSWTPLFTLASGVIVEVGGMLSHASTIAREYGLPALANVKHATRVLKTGDRVVLDASGGVVRRLQH